MSRLAKTIVARATPSGLGALAIVRFSGNDALSIVSRFFKPYGKEQLGVTPRLLLHGRLFDVNTKNYFDDVLVFYMKAPASFTGDDVIEITCHNNDLIVAKILEQGCSLGACCALPGEFSSRAVINGKIDLTQAEGINELIAAQNEEALSLALSQATGSLSLLLKELEEKVLTALAVVEAHFEFFDEGTSNADDTRVALDLIESIGKTVDQLGFSVEKQSGIRQGMRVALIGSVNAGKSTLFNALIGKARAIVSDAPGTTRDTIEASMSYKGHTLLFIDTAGVRVTNDFVESLGIEKTYEEALLADQILLVIDQSAPLEEKEFLFYEEMIKIYQKKIIGVLTKKDKQEVQLPPLLKQSLSTEQWYSVDYFLDTKASGLLDLIISRWITTIHPTHKAAFLLSARQQDCIRSLQYELKEVRVFMQQEIIPGELLAYHLRQMLSIFSLLTGKAVTEKMLDQVFQSFCVGK